MKGNMVVKYINHKQRREIKILDISTINNKGKIEFVEYKGPSLFLNTCINPILATSIFNVTHNLEFMCEQHIQCDNKF